MSSTIVWTGIQADLALGSNLFHSHPLSTHVWYQNVQLTFRRQFRRTFTEQDSEWKHKVKVTKSIHSSSRKKRIPQAMVFPRMRTWQVQWRNWDRGVCRSFLLFIFLRYFHHAPAASCFRNDVVIETFQNTCHFIMLTPPALNWLIRWPKVQAVNGRHFRLLCRNWNWFWHSRKINK